MLLEEIAGIPQWVVAKRSDKIPLCARTLLTCDVSNSIYWSSHKEAMLAILGRPEYLMGFVITPETPYSCIDFDATDDPRILANQVEIYTHIKSYSERSPSGKGLHIWVRGKLPENIVAKKEGIEVYTRNHYMTVTGDAVNGHHEAVDGQAMLDWLWSSYKKHTATIVTDGPQIDEDDTILNRAANATNGLTFSQLWSGDLTAYNGDASRADQALMNIIAFYTDNKQQVARIFRMSMLGRRSKANREDYIQRTIDKAFDQKLQPIDVTTIENNHTVLQQSRLAIAAPIHIDKPIGMMGDIASFIYERSPYPLQETAIAGAISFMSGAFARAFSVNGMPLNLYTVLVAPTGAGKEAISTGITSLVRDTAQRLKDSIGNTNPGYAPNFSVGSLSGGQALMKRMNETPCMLYKMDEFGHFLEQLNSVRVSSTMKQLRQDLLTLFGVDSMAKTGDQVYSKKDNSNTGVDRPALSVIGMSTPETFFGAMSNEMLGEGFVARFLTIEKLHASETYNKHAGSVKVSKKLSDMLLRMLHWRDALEHCGVPQAVTFDEEAEQLNEEYRAKARRQNVKHGSDPIAQLYNRTHVKVMRLAALLAIGCSWDEHTDTMQPPVITGDMLRWAISMDIRGMECMSSRFVRGEIGVGNQRANADFMRVLNTWFSSRIYSPGNTPYREQLLISYREMLRSVNRLQSFRMDTARMLKICIDSAVDSGIIAACAHPNPRGGKCYQLVDATALDSVGTTDDEKSTELALQNPKVYGLEAS
jgi:hypothetical protein